MRKLLSLFAIAALLMMLGGCSKEGKGPEAPVNEEQIFTESCPDCHTSYRIKGKTWASPETRTSITFTQYSESRNGYSLHTIKDGQEDQFVPFAVSSNGQYLKWICVGNKDGKDCGRELKVEFDEGILKVTTGDPMPQTRTHLLL